MAYTKIYRTWALTVVGARQASRNRWKIAGEPVSDKVLGMDQIVCRV